MRSNIVEQSVYLSFTEKWPKTALGLPSTAGNTAGIAFIIRGKVYVGHGGDSGINSRYTSYIFYNFRAYKDIL